VPITPIYVNRRIRDDERRARIFDGGLFLYTCPPASGVLIDWIHSLVQDAFGAGTDARRAHEAYDVQEFVKRAAPLKSRFTNDPTTKRLCQELIVAMGCDPELTYFDLPRLRVIPPNNYLTSGVSYNYKPHRDTWYAHPRQLINYWVPAHDSEPTNVMSMYVDFFHQPVSNASGEWDYDEWVKNSRFAAAKNVGAETRPHPLPLEEVGGSTDLRLVQNGGDMMLFSTCQLHASAPNQTLFVRYSYDLRTLHIEDLRSQRGPSNLDGRAGGSTLQDFLRVSDLQPLEPAALTNA